MAAVGAEVGCVKCARRGVGTVPFDERRDVIERFITLVDGARGVSSADAVTLVGGSAGTTAVVAAGPVLFCTASVSAAMRGV